MKHLKKILSLLVAIVLALGTTITAFADSTAQHTITITNDKKGHIYEAYQVFAGDLDSTKTILSNIKWGTGVDGTGVLKELVKLEAFVGCTSAKDVAEILKDYENDSDMLDTFAQIAGEHLTSTLAGISMEQSSPYTIDVTGDGYYLVKDADGSVTDEEDAYTKFIIQVVKNVEVEAKADAPSLTKKIIENKNKVDANNAAVGDAVSYELTSVVPKMDGYDKYFFVIHDTLSEGLTFDADSVSVKIGAITLDIGQYQVLTSEVTDDCSFEIILNDFIQYKDKAGTAITITYSAVVGEKAVIGEAGNTNTAHLEYSNNPNVTQKGASDNPDKPDPKDETGETPDDITVTYVTGIELIKVDDSKEANRLKGAEFTIEGEKLNKVEAIDGNYTEAIEGKVTAMVNDNGELHFKGLSEGTYMITEVKAPDGYNLLEKPITVVITCEEPEKIDTGEETATWKYELSGALTLDESIASDGVIKLTVVNKPGAKLPSTGGAGTAAFYMIGTVLMLGAAMTLLVKRTVNAR